MELTELKRRRKALVNKMAINSIAILSSANRNFRTRDVENPFRQESDFLYLTGISEPNLLFVMFEKDNELTTKWLNRLRATSNTPVSRE